MKAQRLYQEDINYISKVTEFLKENPEPEGLRLEVKLVSDTQQIGCWIWDGCPIFVVCDEGDEGDGWRE